MATTVHVDLQDRSYDIHIGAAILEQSPLAVAGANVLLVSDEQVSPLHAGRVQTYLEQQGCRVQTADIPAGENSKRLSHLETLCEAAVAAGLDRKAAIVTLRNSGSTGMKRSSFLKRRTLSPGVGTIW